MNQEGVVRALRRAKIYLATNRMEWIRREKDEFICHALDRTKDIYAQQAISVIMHRLHDEGTVTGWLMNNVPAAVAVERDNRDKFEDEVQKYRHRWLDALIEEFSK